VDRIAERTALAVTRERDAWDVAIAAGVRPEPAPERAAAAPGWMAGRALVIEPEGERSGRVAALLRTEGLVVEETADAAWGLARALSRAFDLVIVDPDAAGLERWQACRELRGQSDVPLIVVSTRCSEADLVLGFDAGADDYLDAPFSTAELLSRVRALLRRRQLDLRPPSAVIRVGELELDKLARTVTLTGVPVGLTPTEFRLLELLADPPGRTCEAREILRSLWRCDHVPDTGACKAHISNLRQKLERDPSRPQRIVTVRGVGYRLAAV
jgi:DNA-binding response OmpR family regulator